MKQLVYISCCLIILSYSFMACNADKEALIAENAELKEQLAAEQQYSEQTAQESRTIDTLLDKITGIQLELQSGSLKGNDLVAKTQLADSLMQLARIKIEQQQQQIAKQGAALAQKDQQLLAYAKAEDSTSLEDPTLETAETVSINKTQLFDLSQRLERQHRVLTTNDSLIRSLQKQLAESKATIKVIGNELEDKKTVISSQDQRIQQQLAVLQHQEATLIQKEKELEVTKAKAIQDLKRQRNNFYLNAAAQQIDIVRLAPGMAKRKKEKIIKDAWNYLCQAHQAGHYNALTELNKLQRDAKLGKFVRGKTCN